MEVVHVSTKVQNDSSVSKYQYQSDPVSTVLHVLRSFSFPQCTVTPVNNHGLLGEKTEKITTTNTCYDITGSPLQGTWLLQSTSSRSENWLFFSPWGIVIWHPDGPPSISFHCTLLYISLYIVGTYRCLVQLFLSLTPQLKTPLSAKWSFCSQPQLCPPNFWRGSAIMWVPLPQAPTSPKGALSCNDISCYQPMASAVMRMFFSPTNFFLLPKSSWPSWNIMLWWAWGLQWYIYSTLLMSVFWPFLQQSTTAIPHPLKVHQCSF